MKKSNFNKAIYVALTAVLFTCYIAQANNEVADETRTKTEQRLVISTDAGPVENSSTWGRDYFPNFTLTTQDGEKVKFFDDLIEGKIVAINFIFTSCGYSCPVETARLKNVKEILGDRVGKDIFFYSITIDPDTDTPAVLKDYKEKYNIGADWTFLTGDEDEIIELRKKLGLYIDLIDNNEENPMDHNLSMVIGNQASGRWMRRSPFENPNVLAAQLGDWLDNWKSVKTQKSYADAPEMPEAIAGELIYRTRCSSCHQFGQDGVGPDLFAVTRRRDPVWLARWIKEPDKMLEERDPLAISLFDRYKIPMPNMRLTERDIEEVIGYMEFETDRLIALEQSGGD
ncbi:MAG: cytochrome oxidase Cu insertion factor (SCO1/SenC/PrrC family) [Halioglobus sp.]|jgi:protein SCO1/2